VFSSGVVGSIFTFDFSTYSSFHILNETLNDLRLSVLNV